MPLVLSRQTGESIQIGDDVTITVVSIDRTKVRLLVKAPRDVLILRTELLDDAEPEIAADLTELQRDKDATF